MKVKFLSEDKIDYTINNWTHQLPRIGEEVIIGKFSGIVSDVNWFIADYDLLDVIIVLRLND